jgi:hypothetical protein
MPQQRAALSALLRPEFKPGGGFNRPGFVARYDALLDAAGVPRDDAAPSLPPAAAGRAYGAGCDDRRGAPEDRLPREQRAVYRLVWYDNDLDAKAATTGIEDDREAINGGQTGVNEVRRRFDNRIAEMLRRERAAA